MIWKKTQLAYLAGIIDADGSFHIGRTEPRKFVSRIYVVSTDKILVDWLKKNFMGLRYQRNNPKNPNWKTKFEWILDKAKVDTICSKIIPFLTIKKEQAKLMIKFRKTFIPGKRKRISDDILNFRIQCYENMKKLNQRIPV